MEVSAEEVVEVVNDAMMMLRIRNNPPLKVLFICLCLCTPFVWIRSNYI
jgi:hypothetical protein